MSGRQDMHRDTQLWEQAERHLARKDFEQARSGFQALVQQRPDHLMARLRLSTLATAQGRYRESLQQLLAIAALRPADPDLLALLAGMLHRLGESRVAIDCLAHPAWGAESDRGLLEEAAQLASQLEDMELSARLLEAARRQGALGVPAQYTDATVKLFRGQLDAAAQVLEGVVQTVPGHAQAHWALARLRRQTPSLNHVDRLQASLVAATDDASLAYLGYALFKELDDLDRRDEAWEALATACAAKRRVLGYRTGQDAAAFAELHSLPVSPAEPAGSSPGPRPVFIIGMPRTGTTLLETILGRHPSVANAGELDDFPLQLRWCVDRFSKSFLDPAVFHAARDVDLPLLGARYREHSAWRAGGKPVFTDKLPLNYLHVGLIVQALPEARIVHMTRQPMDTCFSNLKELFAEAYSYSYGLDDLAAHYGSYRRLMSHWHGSFPGRIHEVAYEDLVSEPEATARGVMEFCGLDWRPDCVQVEASERVVTTASSVQVREAIHRRGIEGWRRYERQLEPLRARLHADGWLAP